MQTRHVFHLLILLPIIVSSVIHSIRLLVLGESRPAGLFAGLESARQRVLRGDAVDAVNAVEVLDQGDLVTRGRALARGNCGGREEVLPDLRAMLWLADMLLLWAGIAS
jgi:hypothetical protein